jgi:hypothetical protein
VRPLDAPTKTKILTKKPPPVPLDLDALLEVMAEFTAAGSDEDVTEKIKKIYQQSAERNASGRD